jgi:F-type H+-transporting ATPase subunit epsilon
VIHFQLVSPSGMKFDDDAHEVIVPTEGGTIAIYADHMPILGAVAPGVVSVRRKAGASDADMDHFAVNGGVVEVDGKNIVFIAEDVSSSEEISEKEAEIAHARAEELMKNAGNQVALDEAKQLLQHAGARLHVARLKKRHHR